MDDFELLKQQFNAIINTFNYSKIIRMGISLEICSDYTYNKSGISSILEHNEFNESLQIFNRIIEADTLPITEEFNNTELTTLIHFLKEQYVEDKNSLNIFKKETFFKRLLLAIKLFTSINYTDADYDFKFLVDSKYYRGDDFYRDKYGENFIYPGSPPRFVDNMSDLLNQLQGLINKARLESGQELTPVSVSNEQSELGSESSHVEDTEYIVKLIQEINNINNELGTLFQELYSSNNLSEIKQNIDIDKYFIDIPDEEIEIAYKKGQNALLILYLEKMLFNMLYTKLVELNQNNANVFREHYIQLNKDELQDIIKQEKNNNQDWTKFIEIKDIDDAYKKGKDRLLHLILTHIIEHEEYLIQLEATELVKAFNPTGQGTNPQIINVEIEEKEGEKEKVPEEERLLYEYLLNELKSLNKNSANEFEHYLFGKSANVLKKFLFIIKEEGKIEWINNMSEDVIHAAYELKGDKAKYALYFIILNAFILYEQGQQSQTSNKLPSNQKEDKGEHIRLLFNKLLELDLEAAGYFFDNFYFNTIEQVRKELSSIQTNKFDNPLKSIPTEQTLDLQDLQILILDALIEYEKQKKTQPIQGITDLNDKINLLKDELSKLSRFAYTFYSNDLDISHKETLKNLLLKEINDATKKQTVFLNVTEGMIENIYKTGKIEDLKLLWLETVVDFLKSKQPKN